MTAVRVDAQVFRCKKCRRIRRDSRLISTPMGRICKDESVCASIVSQLKEGHK